MRALLVPVDADLLAVPLAEVHEVLPLPEVTPLPTAPPSVLGLTTLRGEVLAVLDSARLLGRTGSPATHLAVLDVDGRKVAVTATGSPGLATLGEEVPGGPDRPGTWVRADDLVVLRVDPTTLVAGL